MIAVFPLMQNHLTCIIFLLPYNDLLLVSAGEVQCEQPNNSLYTFTGNLIIEKQTLPLSPNQLLLRVCFDLHFFNSEQLIYLPSSFLLKGHQQLIRLQKLNTFHRNLAVLHPRRRKEENLLYDLCFLLCCYELMRTSLSCYSAAMNLF